MNEQIETDADFRRWAEGDIARATRAMDDMIESRDNAYALMNDLAARMETTTAERDALLAACYEAHVVLCHYHLERKPNGVDWEPPADLRHKTIDQLWRAIEPLHDR